MRRKILAVLLAAAMAISLLAGCGGGKALSQVIVDLLDNLYSNVSVEADSDLTAALKQAAAEGGTEEEILSRMIEILNHKGGSITFTLLGSGQQGEHGVTLYFQPGTDPDAAARNALAQWAGTLGTLPDDGSYQGDVAMIETENGYYIALDVEVLKAGKPDKPDKDDDEPEQQEPPEQEKGYSYDPDSDTYTVKEADGLQELFNDKKNNFDENTVIKLTTNQTITGTEPLTDSFNGTLQGENGAKIILSGASRVQGLFNEIGEDGQVLNVDIVVDGNINGSDFTGAVAGKNNGGTISNCDVVIGSGVTISGSYSAGGIVGWNTDGGEISGCTVTGGTIESTNQGDVGGIVGANGAVSTSGIGISGSIIGCSAEVTVKNNNYGGGVVGKNYSGSITACFSTGAVTGGNCTGGVVGQNYGKITACYHAVGEVSGSYAGGVAGFAYNNSVNTCYWSGSPNAGIGSGIQASDAAYSGSDHQNMVGTVTPDWNAAMAAMNKALSGENWHYELGNSSPFPLVIKPGKGA